MFSLLFTQVRSTRCESLVRQSLADRTYKGSQCRVEYYSHPWAKPACAAEPKKCHITFRLRALQCYRFFDSSCEHRLHLPHRALIFKPEDGEGEGGEWSSHSFRNPRQCTLRARLIKRCNDDNPYSTNTEAG